MEVDNIIDPQPTHHSPEPMVSNCQRAEKYFQPSDSEDEQLKEEQADEDWEDGAVAGEQPPAGTWTAPLSKKDKKKQKKKQQKAAAAAAQVEATAEEAEEQVDEVKPSAEEEWPTGPTGKKKKKGKKGHTQVSPHPPPPEQRDDEKADSAAEEAPTSGKKKSKKDKKKEKEKKKKEAKNGKAEKNVELNPDEEPPAKPAEEAPSREKSAPDQATAIVPGADEPEADSAEKDVAKDGTAAPEPAVEIAASPADDAGEAKLADKPAPALAPKEPQTGDDGGTAPDSVADQPPADTKVDGAQLEEKKADDNNDKQDSEQPEGAKEEYPTVAEGPDSSEPAEAPNEVAPEVFETAEDPEDSKSPATTGGNKPSTTETLVEDTAQEANEVDKVDPSDAPAKTEDATETPGPEEAKKEAEPESSAERQEEAAEPEASQSEVEVKDEPPEPAIEVVEKPESSEEAKPADHDSTVVKETPLVPAASDEPATQGGEPDHTEADNTAPAMTSNKSPEVEGGGPEPEAKPEAEAYEPEAEKEMANEEKLEDTPAEPPTEKKPKEAALVEGTSNEAPVETEGKLEEVKSAESTAAASEADEPADLTAGEADADPVEEPLAESPGKPPPEEPQDIEDKDPNSSNNEVTPDEVSAPKPTETEDQAEGASAPAENERLADDAAPATDDSTKEPEAAISLAPEDEAKPADDSELNGAQESPKDLADATNDDGDTSPKKNEDTKTTAGKDDIPDEKDVTVEDIKPTEDRRPASDPEVTSALADKSSDVAEEPTEEPAKGYFEEKETGPIHSPERKEVPPQEADIDPENSGDSAALITEEAEDINKPSEKPAHDDVDEDVPDSWNEDVPEKDGEPTFPTEEASASEDKPETGTFPDAASVKDGTTEEAVVTEDAEVPTRDQAAKEGDPDTSAGKKGNADESKPVAESEDAATEEKPETKALQPTHADENEKPVADAPVATDSDAFKGEGAKADAEGDPAKPAELEIEEVPAADDKFAEATDDKVAEEPDKEDEAPTSEDKQAPAPNEAGPEEVKGEAEPSKEETHLAAEAEEIKQDGVSKTEAEAPRGQPEVDGGEVKSGTTEEEAAKGSLDAIQGIPEVQETSDEPFDIAKGEPKVAEDEPTAPQEEEEHASPKGETANEELETEAAKDEPEAAKEEPESPKDETSEHNPGIQAEKGAPEDPEDSKTAEEDNAQSEDSVVADDTGKSNAKTEAKVGNSTPARGGPVELPEKTQGKEESETKPRAEPETDANADLDQKDETEESKEQATEAKPETPAETEPDATAADDKDAELQPSQEYQEATPDRVEALEQETSPEKAEFAEAASEADNVAAPGTDKAEEQADDPGVEKNTKTEPACEDKPAEPEMEKASETEAEAGSEEKAEVISQEAKADEATDKAEAILDTEVPDEPEVESIAQEEAKAEGSEVEKSAEIEIQKAPEQEGHEEEKAFKSPEPEPVSKEKPAETEPDDPPETEAVLDEKVEPVSEVKPAEPEAEKPGDTEAELTPQETKPSEIEASEEAVKAPDAETDSSAQPEKKTVETQPAAEGEKAIKLEPAPQEANTPEVEATTEKIEPAQPEKETAAPEPTTPGTDKVAETTKATEEEESKDSVGPIPVVEKQTEKLKKGEKHHELNDTPALGEDLQKDGVLALHLDEVPTSTIPSNENGSALATVDSSGAEPPSAVVTQDLSDQRFGPLGTATEAPSRTVIESDEQAKGPPANDTDMPQEIGAKLERGAGGMEVPPSVGVSNDEKTAMSQLDDLHQPFAEDSEQNPSWVCEPSGPQEESLTQETRGSVQTEDVSGTVKSTQAAHSAGSLDEPVTEPVAAAGNSQLDGDEPKVAGRNGGQITETEPVSAGKTVSQAASIEPAMEPGIQPHSSDSGAEFASGVSQPDRRKGDFSSTMKPTLETLSTKKDGDHSFGSDIQGADQRRNRDEHVSLESEPRANDGLATGAVGTTASGGAGIGVTYAVLKEKETDGSIPTEARTALRKGGKERRDTNLPREVSLLNGEKPETEDAQYDSNGFSSLPGASPESRAGMSHFVASGNMQDSARKRRPTVTHSSTQTEDEYFKHQGTLTPTSTVAPRVPTPGVVIPDTEMVNKHRARTLRRKRKMSIQNAEDTVAAAVVIYATAEALSPPTSPSLPGSPQSDQNLPSLDHQLNLQGEYEHVPAVPAWEEVAGNGGVDLRTSVADLYAEDREKDDSSPRRDGDKERHRKRRHSQQSTHSSRSRDEEDVKESRRRSSYASHGTPHASYGSHQYGRRADSAESSSPRTPPRTPRRRDSGFSADSSGSSGRRYKTAEEQAAHDKRKAERRAREKEYEWHGSPHSGEVRMKEREESERRRHRSSRRHSHSHHSRPEPPREPLEAENDGMPEKRFFDLKNTEGVLRSSSSTPTREDAVPIETGTRPPPRVEVPKRSGTTRSKHGSSRRSTDEPRVTLSSRTPREEPSAGASKRAPPEDAARRARHQERKKVKEEERKPGGIKAAFKRLFTSS